MTEFFYVVKIGLATVVFILLMQTEWDNKPLENHLMTWIKTSPMVDPVRDFSARGAVMVRKTYKEATAYVDEKLRSNKKSADRKSFFNFKRNAAVEEKQKNRDDVEGLETDKSQAGF